MRPSVTQFTWFFAVLVVSGCATFRPAGSVADQGVLLSLSPSQAEQALGSIMKSRGSPVVDRAIDRGTVNLKFKSATSVLYAEVSPAGDQSRLRLFGTSLVPLETGRFSPERTLEVTHQQTPEWMSRWLGGSWLAFDWHSEPAGEDAVKGALIELEQAGLTSQTEPRAQVSCQAERDPSWASADARTKAALLERCHVHAPN